MVAETPFIVAIELPTNEMRRLYNMIGDRLEHLEEAPIKTENKDLQQILIKHITS